MNAPTLNELRARVFKHSDGGIERGHFLARRWARPWAVPVTWCAVRLGWMPHQITALALVTYLLGCAGLASGSRAGFLAGVFCVWLGYWLDHVDGQVARWRGCASLTGTAFDYWMHHLVNVSMGFAVGYGLAQRTGQSGWVLAGFATGSGWLMLALADDCRYKAFFQRLKREAKRYHVVGQAGAIELSVRQGSISWRRRLVRLGLRACEHPNVLMALGYLSLIALVSPGLWLNALRLWILAMGLLAPALACARLARTVHTGAVDTDFADWFQVAKQPLPRLADEAAQADAA